MKLYKNMAPIVVLLWLGKIFNQRRVKVIYFIEGLILKYCLTTNGVCVCLEGGGGNKIVQCYPSASQASGKVANLTERKNPHTPEYGVKELVHMSVCLIQTLTPIILGLAIQNGLKYFKAKAAIFYIQSWIKMVILHTASQ